MLILGCASSMFLIRESGEVGFYNTPGYANGVDVAGSFAYIADSFNGLRVIDISNPAAPVEVGFFITPGRGIESGGGGKLCLRGWQR